MTPKMHPTKTHHGNVFETKNRRGRPGTVNAHAEIDLFVLSSGPFFLLGFRFVAIQGFRLQIGGFFRGTRNEPNPNTQWNCYMYLPTLTIKKSLDVRRYINHTLSVWEMRVFVSM